MWKSRLERDFATLLEEHGVAYEYESDKIPYTIPESKHNYITDFKVHGIYFETKGYFDPDARKKMLNVIRSNPGIKVIMVFSHPEKPIRKGSPTTYAAWCDKNGIPWTTLEEFEKNINNQGALNDLLERGKAGVGVRPSNRRRKAKDS